MFALAYHLHWTLDTISGLTPRQMFMLYEDLANQLRAN